MFSQSPVSTVGYKSYCEHFFLMCACFFQLNGDIMNSYAAVIHLRFFDCLDICMHFDFQELLSLKNMLRPGANCWLSPHPELMSKPCRKILVYLRVIAWVAAEEEVIVGRIPKLS